MQIGVSIRADSAKDEHGSETAELKLEIWAY